MPPARAYSTSPVRRCLAASQRAFPDAVQAVEIVRSGPEAPIERASCAETLPSSRGARRISSESPRLAASSASLRPEVALPRTTLSEASTSSRTAGSSPERISSAASRTSRKPLEIRARTSGRVGDGRFGKGFGIGEARERALGIRPERRAKRNAVNVDHGGVLSVSEAPRAPSRRTRS